MKGRVDVRHNQDRGIARLRFHSLHADQVQNVLLALQIARQGMGTEHDSVALDAICTHFLSTFEPGAPLPKTEAPRASEIENTLPAVVEIADYQAPVEPEHPEDCKCSSCVVEIGPYVPPPEVLLTVEHAERILDREFPAWREALFPPPAVNTDDGRVMIPEIALRQWIVQYGPEPEGDDEEDAILL